MTDLPPEPICPKCLKEELLCVCDRVTPMKTRHHVLILQHPQEPDKELGTARLTHLALSNSTMKVGLSWPNLASALGRPAIHGNWGVLYLGGQPPKTKPKPHASQAKPKRLTILAKNQELSPDDAELEGIVVLDGTWSQAKTLWWRNAWLLKLKRLVLSPSRPSMYGKLRKEPRRECLSTIESVAEALEALGEDPAAGETLRAHFAELLRKFQAR
jgi:DTW domain-containing protein YfiP